MTFSNTVKYFIFIFLFEFLCSLPVFADLNAINTIRQRVDSLIDSNEKEIWVERVDTTCKMFAAGAFSNLNILFPHAAKPLLNFDTYDFIFKHVDLIKGIGYRRGKHHIADDYYAEGKALFINAWGLGRVDTLVYYPDSCLFLKIRPTKNIALLNWYRKKNKGIFRYYIKNIHIDAYLIKINSEQCRIGVFAWAITRTKVPSWLIAFAMRIMIPRFITDLERYALKNKKRYFP